MKKKQSPEPELNAPPGAGKYWRPKYQLSAFKWQWMCITRARRSSTSWSSLSSTRSKCANKQRSSSCLGLSGEDWPAGTHSLTGITENHWANHDSFQHHVLICASKVFLAHSSSDWGSRRRLQQAKLLQDCSDKVTSLSTVDKNYQHQHRRRRSTARRRRGARPWPSLIRGIHLPFLPVTITAEVCTHTKS